MLVPGLPTIVMDPVPTVFILFAVGDTAPPLFPVRVSVDPDPLKVTKPFASTAKSVLSNDATPALAPLDAPCADAFCTLMVTTSVAPVV